MDGRIVSWSPAMERRYGIARDAAIGRDAAPLLGTVFPASVVEINDAFRARGAWRGGILTRRGDGAPLLTASEWRHHGGVTAVPGLVAETHADPAASLADDDGRLTQDLLTVISTFLLEAVSAASVYAAAGRRILDAAGDPRFARLAAALDGLGAECRRGHAGIAMLRALTNTMTAPPDQRREPG